MFCAAFIRYSAEARMSLSGAKSPAIAAIASLAQTRGIQVLADDGLPTHAAQLRLDGERFPTKPVTLMVPYPAGGISDVIALRRSLLLS